MIELSNDFLEASIRRGAILHSYMFHNIDHGKFFVVVGVSEDRVAGFFFINSQINKFLFRSQDLLNSQILIRKDDYDFLTHDSFISAIKFTEIKVSDIIDSINRNETKFVEELKDKDLDNVLECIRTSRLFTDEMRNKYAK